MALRERPLMGEAAGLEYNGSPSGQGVPAVSEDADICHGSDGLHCYNPDGEQLWYCLVPFPEDSTPVVRDDGSISFVAARL